MKCQEKDSVFEAAMNISLTTYSCCSLCQTTLSKLMMKPNFAIWN